MRFQLLVLLAALAASARAQECVIRSDSPSWTGDTVAFSLACDTPVTSPVSWEFGDGEGLDSADALAVVRHAYAAAGSYVVFARSAGLPFPVNTLHMVAHAPTASRPTRSATLIYDAARSRVWCVNADNHSVTVLDARTLVRLREIPTGRHPRSLALDSLGRIWVANQDDATLTVLDGGNFSVLHSIAMPYASRPHGICFDPKGGTAYVTLEAAGRLIRLDAAGLRITGDLALFPSPRGIAVSHDGARVLVTRFLSPADRGEVADVAAGPAAFTLTRIVPLAYDAHPENESNGPGVPNALASVTISPDGRRAWIPFKKDNVRRGLFADPPGGPPTFESTVRTAVAQLDLAGGREEYSARKDLDNRSMASAVAFDSKGVHAYVATLTSNHTAVIRTATGADATSIEPAAADHELSPDGLVLGPSDSLLFIHYFMSREVAVYDVSRVGGTGERPRLALIPTVEREALAAEVLRGKQVFYNAADPRMARDRYLACAACHMDGLSDGRVWDFTHKGEGLRRTTSLLGRAGLGHGPVHWSANFDEIQDFEHDIRGAFGGSGFLRDEDFLAGRDTPLGGPKAGLSPDLDALAAYVTSLSRVNPSPFRNPDGSLTADALAGERIFHSPEAGCAACHAPPRFTDSDLDPAGPGVRALPGGFLLHDVGTLKPGSGKRLNDTLQGLDTPTLLGIWETGPYLHDGSAPTLLDVLTTANPSDRHGKTSHLDAAQKNQLVAYLQQLDQGSAQPNSVRPSPALSPGRGRLSLRALAGGYEMRWNAPGAGADAVLRLYDVRGRLAAVLRPAAATSRPQPGALTGDRNGMDPSGSGGDGVTLRFRWDGRDAGGGRAQSGAYLCKLAWRGGSASQRVFLVPR